MVSLLGKSLLVVSLLMIILTLSAISISKLNSSGSATLKTEATSQFFVEGTVKSTSSSCTQSGNPLCFQLVNTSTGNNYQIFTTDPALNFNNFVNREVTLQGQVTNTTGNQFLQVVSIKNLN